MSGRPALYVFAVATFALLITQSSDAEKVSQPWTAPDRARQPVVQLDKVAIVQGSFVELAKKVNPAVVNIYTTKKVRMGMRGRGGGGMRAPNDPFELFEQFFGPYGMQQQREAPEQKSLGSGFIIHPDGFVATNNHVVEGADEIKVKLGEGKSKNDEFTAELVGTDARTDIALLKIKSKQALNYLPLGDSDVTQVGEWVMAVGNPFGLGHTVTVGIVSAKGRDLFEQLNTPYTNFIQTDAAINLGNSGGPLVNVYGEVIGINAAINAGANSIGFAIPTNLAKRVLTDLQNKGHVSRGWLGVEIAGEVDEKMAKHFGLKEPGGVVIGNVLKGDPADKAGIRPYDIVLEIDGKKTETQRDLLQTVADLPIGKKVPVLVFRSGKPMTLQLTIAKRKDDAELAKQDRGPERGGERQDALGLSVAPIDSPLGQQLRIPPSVKGVLVTSVDPEGTAYQEGVRAGDVITSVNQKPVENLNQYKSLISRSKDSVLLGLLRQGAPLLIVVPKK
jgi:serine protease Do